MPSAPGRIRRRFFVHMATEWVILRGKDNSVRKIRIKPKQPRIAWRENEASGVREFVRQRGKTEDGLPLYLEVANEPDEAVA